MNLGSGVGSCDCVFHLILSHPPVSSSKCVRYGIPSRALSKPDPAGRPLSPSSQGRSCAVLGWYSDSARDSAHARQGEENVLEAGAVTSPGVGDGGASDANRGTMRCCVLGRSGARGEKAQVGDTLWSM